MIIEICLSFRVYLNCVDIYIINQFHIKRLFLATDLRSHASQFLNKLIQ